MDQIEKINFLIKYRRDSPLSEQSFKDGTAPEPQSKPKVTVDPCKDFKPTQGCNTRYSVCPGPKSEFNWTQYCWYVGLKDGRTSLAPTPKIIGVPVGSRVDFIDAKRFQELEYKFFGGDQNFRKDVLNNSENKNPGLFKQWISYFSTKLTETQRSEYISKYLIPPGSIYRINTPNGKLYTLKFELFYDVKQKSGVGGAMGATDYTVKLRRKGYFTNQGEEYKPSRESDLRTDRQKFVDEWGTFIQVVGAIAFAVASAYTGGAAWAVAGELAVELGMGSFLAHRQLEKGSVGGAAFEIAFGLLPFLKLSPKFAGVSREVLQSTAKKYARSGLSANSTQAEILSFWRTLSPEEAKTLRMLEEFDEVNLGKLVNEIKSLTGDPKKLIKRLLTSVNDLDEAKSVLIRFIDSSSGKELGLTGLLLCINAIWSYKYGNDLEKSVYDGLKKLLEKESVSTQEEIVKNMIMQPEVINKITNSIPELLNIPKPEDFENTVAWYTGEENHIDLDNDQNFSDVQPEGSEVLYYPGHSNYKDDDPLWIRIENGDEYEEWIPPKDSSESSGMYTWVRFK